MEWFNTMDNLIKSWCKDNGLTLNITNQYNSTRYHIENIPYFGKWRIVIDDFDQGSRVASILTRFETYREEDGIFLSALRFPNFNKFNGKFCFHSFQNGLTEMTQSFEFALELIKQRMNRK